MKYIETGRWGQGSCAPSKPPELSVEDVKALYHPRIYYPSVLRGRLGRSRPSGWCEWVGLCPFHDDHRVGSVFINLVSGAFKCFACGVRAGDVLAFHARLKGLTFREVLLELGERQ